MTETPPSASIPTSAPPADATSGEMICIHCGYNLSGLDLSGRCPECGAPIEQSTRGDLLKFADPQWVEKLRRGTLLMLWNILFRIVSNVISGVFKAFPAIAVLSVIPTAIASGLGLWAIILVTSQEPRVSLQENPVSLRRLVRAAAVIACPGEILTSLGTQLGSRWILVSGIVFIISGFVSMFGFFIFMQRFARRIPDETLARQTTVVMWGYCAGTVVLLLAAVLVPTLVPALTSIPPRGAPATPSIPILPLVLGCLGVVLFIFFAIWWLVLLFRYHAAFKKAAADARLLDEAYRKGLLPESGIAQ